jgi:hypothetical protein
MKREFTGEDEDLIQSYKTFIMELQKIQDEYFNNLKDELEVNEMGEEWLYDYVFNTLDDDRDFLVYLQDYSMDQSKFFR